MSTAIQRLMSKQVAVSQAQTTRTEMAATYHAVMLTKAGGPEVLQCVELPIEQPGPGQLRVRVRAAGVGSTDLIMLTGKYLYAPKIPFVPATRSRASLMPSASVSLGSKSVSGLRRLPCTAATASCSCV